MTRAALALVVVAACRPAPAAPARPLVDPFEDDPLATLAGLEDRLTGAREVAIDARVEATGAVDAALTGEVRVHRERDARVDVRGAFDGTEVAARWSSRRPVDPDLRDTQPPTWADSLLLGATRMGVLHDWAMVIGGADPDTAHGDLASWVEVEDVAWRGGDPASRTLTFRIVVGGEPAGEAELTLDERGLPARRAQVVHFAEGDMRVVETYARFVAK